MLYCLYPSIVVVRIAVCNCEIKCWAISVLKIEHKLCSFYSVIKET